MPSPVYQWRKAFLRNMTVNWSPTLRHASWMAVLLPTKTLAIFMPGGGMSQMLALRLLGIHSTK